MYPILTRYTARALRGICLAALAAALALQTPPEAAAQTRPGAIPPAQATLTDPGAGAPNAVTASLQKAGMRRCAAQVQRVTQFLTSGTRSGTTVLPLPPNPDDGLLSISSETANTTTLAYAGASFAPRTDGCSAVYEQVSYWQNSCDEVHQAQFAQLKPMGVLQQAVRVYYNAPQLQVMMMAAGTGCVVIKKEIVH